MSKRRSREEKWDHASLAWIHDARARIYEAEARRPLKELEPKLSPRAAEIARRLNLKTIRTGDLPVRRRRAG